MSYDARTALLVVDLQNDFADPRGSLFVRGGDEVVAVANQEIERAQGAGALVVLTQDWHPPDTPHFAKDGGIWPVHCVRDTWGAELVPGLRTPDGPRVRKGGGGEDGYSAFTVRDPVTGEQTGTELQQLLNDRGITRVVIAGLATDYCVKESALDAVGYGYETVVLTSAVRAVDLEFGDGDRALELLASRGVDLS